MNDDTPHPEDRPNRPWDKNRPPRDRDDRGGRERDDRREEGDRDRDERDERDDRDRPRRRPRPRPSSDPDPSLKFVVPLNTSGVAIVAGYLGLISVLCFPAPFALLFGILALNHLKKNPKLDGKGRAIFAIVMGGLFSIPLVIGLVGFVLGQFK